MAGADEPLPDKRRRNTTQFLRVEEPEPPVITTEEPKKMRVKRKATFLPGYSRRTAERTFPSPLNEAEEVPVVQATFHSIVASVPGEGTCFIFCDSMYLLTMMHAWQLRPTTNRGCRLSMLRWDPLLQLCLMVLLFFYCFYLSFLTMCYVWQLYAPRTFQLLSTFLPLGILLISTSASWPRLWNRQLPVPKGRNAAGRNSSSPISLLTEILTLLKVIMTRMKTQMEMRIRRILLRNLEQVSYWILGIWPLLGWG